MSGFGGGLGPLSGLGGLGFGGAGGAASLGQAASVGSLSVPASWTVAAPAFHTAAVASPIASTSLAAEAATGPAGNTFADMALASMAGRAIGGTALLGRRERGAATTRKRLEPPQRSPVTSIADELSKFADLYDRGFLTEEELAQQKQRLLHGFGGSGDDDHPHRSAG